MPRRSGFRVGLGNQGTRTYLRERGVSFPVINPTANDVGERIDALRAPHRRHRGHKGCAEAADLLQTLLDRAEQQHR